MDSIGARRRPWRYRRAARGDVLVDVNVLPAFIAIIVLFLIPPGPDMAYVVAVGLQGGRRAALEAILGIATGMGVYAAGVVLGIGELARSYPLLLVALKLAGAGYLLWLAFSTIRGARQSAATATHPLPGRWYTRGVVVSLTNPKVMLFFVAVLPQFLGTARQPTAQLALLGAINISMEVLLYGAIGLLAGTLQARFNSSKHATAILHYVAATVYLVLAAVVTTDTIASLTQ